ncbi:MAG TPA: hypothetical protein DGK91_14800 [Clostridium sp.]|nr:hypothetical protein [Clostridia bacterium]HCW05664.1 hypothetical protein [Clostridium sp.]
MKPTGKFIALITLALILILVKALLPYAKQEDNYSIEKVYTYLQDEANQRKVYEKAVELNGGDSANTCVYFVAEVLRRNDVFIDKWTSNTKQLIKILEEKGWQKIYNYEELKPGDLVFTTDHLGNKKGIPSHTYIFMGWVEDGSFDYAYICDNQAKDYDNQVYHIRNIAIVDEANGFTKDAFSFLMRPDV